MPEPAPHITPAELVIMKVLWRDGPQTVRQVLESLSSATEQPAYTTVMTMMKNLADKGALAVDRSRQPFLYTAAIRRDQVLRHKVTDFLSAVFDGHAADLVLHLAEEGNLSAEDLRRIEEKIERHEETTAERGDGEPSP
jgi:predicted transcriptional regulator